MTDEQFETLQELLSVIYIQIARQYDMLAIIGEKLGADTVGLSKEHENGLVLGPDPWMKEETSD